MAEVTVALVGNPMQPERGLEEQDFRRPYRDFPTVRLDVANDEPLAAILARATSDFAVADTYGTPTLPSFVAFYQSADENEYSGRRESVVTLVDEDGRAVWNVHFEDPRVTLDALARASQAGALNGDAHRPYLLLEPAYGNGILPSWNEVVVGFLLLRGVLGTIADVHGAAQAIGSIAARARRLFDRFRTAPDVVEQHHLSWAEQGAQAPIDVERFIDRQPWRSDVLAPLLGCTPDEAETLLTGRGFTYVERDGLWHPEGDADGRALRQILYHMYFVDLSDMSPEGQERLRTEFHRKIIEELGEGDVGQPDQG